MKTTLAGNSLLLFALSIMFLIVVTLLDSVMGSFSTGLQRLLVLLFMVLPAGIGALLGFLSLTRKEGRTGLAVTSMLLNALFALFYLMVVFIAG